MTPVSGHPPRFLDFQRAPRGPIDRDAARTPSPSCRNHVRGRQRTQRLPCAATAAEAAGHRAAHRGHFGPFRAPGGHRCVAGRRRPRALCRAPDLRRALRGPGGQGERLGGRHAPPGHRVALGLQGHRHRPQLRPGAAPRGARHPVPPEAQGAADRQGPRARGRRPGRRGRPAARPHDRIGARRRRAGGQPVQRTAGPADGAGRRANRWPCRAGGGQHRLRPGAGRGRDRLPGGRLHPPGPQPQRRRTDDVRAGQQRALPPQDLQRQLHHRRRGPAAEPVLDDPPHREAEPAAHGDRLCGQRLGDGRRDHRALHSRRRLAKLSKR
ncbi:hypothetical protein D3C71_637600 [compost metagenome]